MRNPNRTFIRSRICRGLFAFFVVTGIAGSAFSQNGGDEYFVLPLNELAFEADDPFPEGVAARTLTGAGAGRVRGGLPGFDRYPYVFLEGAGAAFIENPDSAAWGYSEEASLGDLRVGLRVAGPEALRGILYYPKEGQGFLRLPFALPGEAEPSEPDAFHRVMEEHYERLLAQGIPGHAFFREQRDHARSLRGAEGEADENGFGRAGPGESELARTFSIFSGSRAAAENLALDDELRVEGGGASASEPLEEVDGITTPEFDWDRIEISGPERGDPLARVIPEDQHGLFFDSIGDWLTFRDEYRATGLPLLDLLAFPGDFDGVLERYERQLLLDDAVWSEMPDLPFVKSLAITGGDPYLPSGAAVTVLIETGVADAFVTWFWARSRAEATGQGEYLGRPWREMLSADRSVHAITVVLDGAVAVTNSRDQMRRIIETAEGELPELRETNDYRFFRQRYGPEPEAETGFLVISDATIRRWGRPAARIAASRRTRASAGLLELQIENRDLLLEAADGQGEAGQVVHPGGEDGGGLGEVVLDPEKPVLRDANYNTLGFLTPVDELDVRKATPEEIRAYENWRNRYQGRWGDLFCPIALRFDLGAEAVTTDLMVFPLIENSAFRDFIEVAGENEISAGDGDPHPGALLHFAVAVDPDSEPMREAFRNLRGMLGGQLEINPLDWLGSSAALYVDDGFFWEAVAEAPDSEAFLEENFSHVPLGVHIASRSSARLAVFLAGARNFIEQSAPGLLEWTTEEYKEHEYVKVSPRENFFGSDGLSLTYATPPGAFVASLNERVVHRALDRSGGTSSEAGVPEFEWPGKHLNLRVREDAFPVLRSLFGSGAASEARRSAYRYLPILNEWHRLYPDRDPAAVHAAVYGESPGFGDSYEWNERYKTMTSLRWGHPGEPAGEDAALFGRLGEVREAVFGVTFEMDGLSARAEIDRGEREAETSEHRPDPGEEASVDMRKYFQFEEGARARFRNETDWVSGETEAEALPVEKTDQGILYPVRYTTTWEGDDLDYTKDESIEWYRINPDLTLHRSRKIPEEGEEAVYHYPKPFVFLRGQMIPGTTYSARYHRVPEGPEQEAETVGLVQFRLAGFETVSVAAGTFENTARVEIYNQYSQSDGAGFGQDYTIAWYAEGVGEVRLEGRYEFGAMTRELEVYEHRNSAD